MSTRRTLRGTLSDLHEPSLMDAPEVASKVSRSAPRTEHKPRAGTRVDAELYERLQRSCQAVRLPVAEVLDSLVLAAVEDPASVEAILMDGLGRLRGRRLLDALRSSLAGEDDGKE